MDTESTRKGNCKLQEDGGQPRFHEPCSAPHSAAPLGGRKMTPHAVSSCVTSSKKKHCLAWVSSWIGGCARDLHRKLACPLPTVRSLTRMCAPPQVLASDRPPRCFLRLPRRKEAVATKGVRQGKESLEAEPSPQAQTAPCPPSCCQTEATAPLGDHPLALSKPGRDSGYKILASG